ncbi:MAG: nitroreductase family protein [Nanoarchaeota archaeon]|nr:nitroreductase family protein [Nanoarchaeota archaeon]MBU1005704.1 nitroreductase family protein [Nanoarchaeota archaeon]MBU1946426.1 nitroreductase family protein [Nanoarchaeota archaeon]
MSKIINNRELEYSTSEIFPTRWSPRSMSGGEITGEELMSLFEAARWAPSAYNNQPWRFIYAKKNTVHWDILFNLLADGNKVWVKNAAALIVVVSKTTFDHNNKPSITHSLDTGSAWENLALQGSIIGLVVHGMQGFDYEKAKIQLNISNEYQVEAMAAIGKPGKKENLPKELQEKEFPSDRKKISEIAFEGSFK